MDVRVLNDGISQANTQREAPKQAKTVTKRNLTSGVELGSNLRITRPIRDQKE